MHLKHNFLSKQKKKKNERKKERKKERTTRRRGKKETKSEAPSIAQFRYCSPSLRPRHAGLQSHPFLFANAYPFLHPRIKIFKG